MWGGACGAVRAKNADTNGCGERTWRQRACWEWGCASGEERRGATKRDETRGASVGPGRPRTVYAKRQSTRDMITERLAQPTQLPQLEQLGQLFVPRQRGGGGSGRGGRGGSGSNCSRGGGRGRGGGGGGEEKGGGKEKYEDVHAVGSEVAWAIARAQAQSQYNPAEASQCNSDQKYRKLGVLPVLTENVTNPCAARQPIV